MDINDFVLVDLVKQFTIVYDKNNKNFKNKLMRENAWKTISKALNCNTEVCQKRWTVLRTKYGAERKNERTPRSGSGAKKTWPLFSLMSFLDKHQMSRKSAGNLRSMSQTWNASSLPSSTSLSSTPPGSPWNTFVLKPDSQTEDAVEEVAETSGAQSPEFMEVLKLDEDDPLASPSPHTLQATQTYELDNSGNETPPRKKRMSANAEKEVMSTAVTSICDNFISYLEKKESPCIDFEMEASRNFGKTITNDLMSIKSKKIRASAKVKIMTVIQEAISEDS